MGSIRSGIGLISEINHTQLADALMSLQRAAVARLEARATGFAARQTGLKTLEANVVSITTSVQSLNTQSNFQAFTVDNSGKTQVSVTARSTATAGTHHFQAVRKASTFSVISKGFANADTQAVGAGTLTIATGGNLERPTLLDALNSGNGVRRGTVRITDRSGASADVDLSKAYIVNEVLAAINDASGISVTASAEGDRIVLTDTSGSTSTNLSAVDLNGGHAAEDLGIKKSVASSKLSGDAVFTVTGDFTLDQINDGNQLRLLAGAPDIRITLTDDTQFEVNLDGSATLGDITEKINNHEDNGGKVSAAIVDGRIQLTDLTGGGGSSALAVENINDTAVVRQLGLDVAASGNTLTGRKLAAGMNSVLLANLRGGAGTVAGQLSLTDRAGISATIDLSGAESLDEVVRAINAAESGDSTKLQLVARINSVGTGIEIVDTSGATASNLVIADVGGSTLAADLGIAVDAAQNSVNSGSLGHRYVNQATSIGKYAPDGGGIAAGSIRITDSDGNQAVVEISTAVKTVGDVLQRINAASGVSVHAELNETGDGFVIVDEAGGSGALKVEEVGTTTTAADLRILGEGVVGGDGKARISSRFAAVVQVDADDTLNDVADKINAAAGFVKASIVNDGSAFNSTRLVLSSATSGSAGRLFIDSGSLNLGLTTQAEGEDALLRVGQNAATGFLVASATNTFTNAAEGIDVDVLAPGDAAATVTVTRNTKKIQDALQGFVDSFNKFVTASAQLTKFDSETNARGILHGVGSVLRIRTRLDNLVTRRFASSSSTYRSLTDVGVRVRSDGTLELNTERLAAALENDYDAVAGLFLNEDTGFGGGALATIESLTDPFTGSFALEDDALQTSVDSLNKRIEDLDAILLVRRERLLLQLSNMETILSTLTSQQQALSSVSVLKVNNASR